MKSHPQFRSFQSMTDATQQRVDQVIRSVFAAVGDHICQHCIIEDVARECRAEGIQVSRVNVERRVKDLWNAIEPEGRQSMNTTDGGMPMNKQPLTRKDLDPLVCSTPGCDCEGDLVLHSRCHPDAATWARYNKATGNLELSCAVCEHVIAVIGVAGETAGRGAILQ